MKSRLGALLSLAVLSALLVATVQAPAQAAGATARLSRSVPAVNEVVKVYGAVAPARRPARLQKLSRGHWVTTKISRTGSKGRYAFAVRATSAATAYRVLAVKYKRSKARATNRVTVRGVRPSLSLTAPPVSSSGGKNVPLTPVVARLNPARPGAVVMLYRKTGGRLVYAGRARQDAAGAAAFQVSAGTPTSRDSFVARTVPGPGAPVAQSASASSTFYGRQPFRDEFSGTALNGRLWKLRDQPYTAVGGGRHCARPAGGLVAVRGGVATLRVVRTARPTRACPYGTWANAMIGSTFLSSPYGYYSARIRFQSAQGMHGAFWLQGTGESGAEIDTVEYFGNGARAGGLSTFLHKKSATSTRSVGGSIPLSRARMSGGRTPSNGWHTYSVQWSPSGYVFRVDGIPTMSTNQLVSRSGSQIVLSLLTSDWELNHLKHPSSTMQVDWVRSYQ